MSSSMRIGKISSINDKNGMVRVVCPSHDNSPTAEMPLLSTEYFMPEVGDQVLVAHLSNGTAVGVVLGRPWSEKNPPPECGAGLYRKDFSRTPGEAMLRYQDGTLTLKASKVVVDGDMEVTGDLTVTGKLTSGNVYRVKGNMPSDN